MKFMYFFDNNLKRFVMYGKRMLHPQETGMYEAGISCIREDDVNIWFYTQKDVTIAVDAGHLNYKGIDKEFKKIGIDGKDIKHVLLTHSDVDHCGGVDKYAKNYIFPNAKVYIGKGEENYFGGAVCRMIKAGIPLKNPVRLRKGYRTVTDGETLDIDGIKVQVIDVPGHTIGHVCYIVDDKILFSGDSMAINAEGGYSLFDFFTQNPELNKKSLRRLKTIVENSPVEYVCTGHSGMHKYSDKIFAHIDKSAKSSFRKPFDSTASKSIVSK
jgi:glyoxylase-like metal-dependent hydrolase (beta-lactamase superfamily II)